MKAKRLREEDAELIEIDGPALVCVDHLEHLRIERTRLEQARYPATPKGKWAF